MTHWQSLARGALLLLGSLRIQHCRLFTRNGPMLIAGRSALSYTMVNGTLKNVCKNVGEGERYLFVENLSGGFRLSFR